MGADFVVKEKISLNLNAAPDPFPNPGHDTYPFTEPKPLRAKCLTAGFIFVRFNTIQRSFESSNEERRLKCEIFVLDESWI